MTAARKLISFMDAPSTTPHDAVFKQFLMHAETARDFLEIHLPVELRELCDLNTLHLESGSFIEESLKGHSTDVLYSVQMQGNPGYLHVVIEHQSKPDKKMAFRMMRYSIAAMHRHLEADHDKLPLVVPILFYQGEATPYPLSMCWFDMFYSPELARRVYNSPFPLVDITITPDDEIMQHRRIAILELLHTCGTRRWWWRRWSAARHGPASASTYRRHPVRRRQSQPPRWCVKIRTVADAVDVWRR